MFATIEARIDSRLRDRLERLSHEISEPDHRLPIQERLILPVYSYDPITAEPGTEAVDAKAHQETWADMLRLQEEGVYPAAFAAIDVPVLMLHGRHDPHPGRMVRATLGARLPQLEYREWERCGHYPWLERAVRDEFFQVIRSWLTRELGQDHPR